MRTIYLRNITEGCLFGNLNLDSEERLYHISNLRGDSLYLKSPKLRRSVLGVSIVDPDCFRSDRIFTGNLSITVQRGTRPV